MQEGVVFFVLFWGVFVISLGIFGYRVQTAMAIHVSGTERKHDWETEANLEYPGLCLQPALPAEKLPCLKTGLR